MVPIPNLWVHRMDLPEGKTIPGVPLMPTLEEEDSRGAVQPIAGSQIQMKCVGIEVATERHPLGGEHAHLHSMMMTSMTTKKKTIISISTRISTTSSRDSWGTQIV